MTMNARNPDDFLDLIDQAIFEMGELIASAEYESDVDDDFTGMLPTHRQILDELKKLHAAVHAGTYALSGGVDLPFMAVVRKFRGRIPISGLLETINEIQKQGF